MNIFFYVSGVVLANASLDIAFHDKLVIWIFTAVVSTISFFFIKSLPSLNSIYNNSPIILLYISFLKAIGLDNHEDSKEWIRAVMYAYITGILDAKEKGLYVNLNTKKNILDFNIEISLPNNLDNNQGKKSKCRNLKLMRLIQDYLGGDIKINKKKNEVFWFINSLEDKNCKIIDEMLDFWKKIPFFSLKMRQNLNFFVKCYKDINNIQQFLNNVQHIYKKKIPSKDYEFNNIDSNKISINKMYINGYKSLITLKYKGGDHLFLFWLQGYLKIQGIVKVISSFNNKTEFRITSSDENIIKYIVNQFFLDENSITSQKKIDNKRKYNKNIVIYTIIINKKKELKHLSRFYLRSNFTNPCMNSIEEFL